MIMELLSLPDTAFFSYESYLKMASDLLAQNKTTGPDQSPEMIEYARLNLHRMNKWNKVGKLDAAVEEFMATGLPQQTWYIITEPWCGDGAQVTPFLAKMAEASKGKIQMKFLLRDENPEIMELYLTNGTRSIPKLVAVDSSGKELFTWGPRPKAAQDLLDEVKKDPSVDAHVKKERLHKWYADNKGLDVQNELVAVLKTLN